MNYSTPDLSQHPPRSPRTRLGGYAHLPRLLDKARAHAATLGDRSIRDWACRHGGQLPNPSTQAALRTQARADAVRQVLSTELYELIEAEADD